MTHTHAMQAERITKTRGSGLAAGIFILAFLCFVGGIFLWPLWIVSIILILVALTTERTYAICGHCGNEVAPTSALCPTCRSALAHHHGRSAMRSLVKLAWALTILGFLAAWAWFAWHGPQ